MNIMTCHAISIGKYALLACNFIFLLSGLCLVALGCILAHDTPRLLLSILAVEPKTDVQPLFYYVALGFILMGLLVCIVTAVVKELSGLCLVALGCILAHDTPRLLLSILAVEPKTDVQPLLYYVALGFILVGLLVCIVAAVGCWAACVPKTICLMSIYLFLLIVLLVGEVSLGVVAGLCPQLLGVDMSRDSMVENLQRNYGLPARGRYTAAVDLAQTLFQCCGMSSGADYDNAFWRDREAESKREWRVPLSCCIIQNNREVNSFLDPHPINETLCQAKTNALYQQGRHTVGCLDQLNEWFQDHSVIFLTTGLSLIVVQLCVLVSAIFLCVKRGQVPPAPVPHEYPDTASLPRTVVPPLSSDVRSDEIYPTKRSQSPGAVPLVLLSDHFAPNPHRNYFSPKVYNNKDPVGGSAVLDTKSLRNNNLARNNFYERFDSDQGT